MSAERSQWTPVTELMNKKGAVAFGDHDVSWFGGGWRAALCYSSYYKFAAKMIGQGARVLDSGCGAGLGTWILAKECGFAKGIDQDRKAIAVAQKNWSGERILFECCGLTELQPKAWNALVNLDAGRELAGSNKRSFWGAIKRNLSHDGIAILGVSGSSRRRGAKEKARGLEDEMRCHFRHVFTFSACDEAIHAGELRAADHWIVLGCRKK
jgi:cyclopropane fatty-acyl-phospholipid synthase-like methyltransferase